MTTIGASIFSKIVVTLNVFEFSNCQNVEGTGSSHRQLHLINPRKDTVTIIGSIADYNSTLTIYISSLMTNV